MNEDHKRQEKRKSYAEGKCLWRANMIEDEVKEQHRETLKRAAKRRVAVSKEK